MLLPNNHNRPSGIDASNIPLDSLDMPLNNELNNSRYKNLDINIPNNLSSKHEVYDKNSQQLNNLNNIRACGVNIRNVLEKPENSFLVKQNNDGDMYNRLTCRAMLDKPARATRGMSPISVISSDDNTKTAEIDTGQPYNERGIDIPDNMIKNTYESLSVAGSVDNISTHSSKSADLSVFKTPNISYFENKRLKKQSKMMNSCDNLDVNYKLSPKVYLSKPNYSCEELNNLDSNEKCGGYGSLQELFSWDRHCRKMRNIAQSEPDVRIQRDEMESNLGVSL